VPDRVDGLILNTVARARSGGRWSDFRLRLASSLILVPIALLALWRGGWAWQALVMLIMLGLAGEWSRLYHFPRRDPALPVAVFMVWLLNDLFGWPGAGPGILFFTLLNAWRFGRVTALGIPYITLAGCSILWLREDSPGGLPATLFLALVIWGTDIGAYVIGRWLGGAKLAPRISPGKTWSGAVGGLLVGIVSGALVAVAAQAFSPATPFLAALLSLCAQGGDLLESAIKRNLGVKDSGHTIPGHGGLFDRLDGFLAAAPIAALLAVLLPHGLVHGGAM
jgi:phosphatidate cytidylyltransferase